MLFLSARVGVGHTAAASAVSRALQAHGMRCEVVDSYQYAASIFSKVVADGYIGMVKTMPQLYRFIYERAERATHAGAARRWVSSFTAGNLHGLIERMRPSAVVCTHAFPCGVMAAYKERFDPQLPVIGVVTDFVVHPFWIYGNIDAYAVATPEMRAALTSRGIARERIVVSGIPVDARFAQRDAGRDALRERLGLPLDRTLVLMMGGGLGIGPMEMMMQAVDKLELPLAAVAIVGRNARLEKRIVDYARRARYPIRVLGFVDNVYDYMHASDVLLSKPGGLTSAEALVSELPMVLVRPLPGQEERNTRYLVERGAAVRVATERTLVQALDEIARSGACREALERNIRALRRPEAASDVAALIEGLALSASLVR